MNSVLPAVLGIPASELSRLVGLPSWLVIVVVGASLTLGLVRAIIPQDSADRLHLLLALRGCRTRAEVGSGITVTGHVMDDQESAAARGATTAPSTARTGGVNSASSGRERGPRVNYPHDRTDRRVPEHPS
jgi:hypothetical protein